MASAAVRTARPSLLGRFSRNSHCSRNFVKNSSNFMKIRPLTDGHNVPIFLLYYSVEFAQGRSTNTTQHNTTQHTFLNSKTRAVKQQRLACSQDVSSSNLGRDINYLRVKIIMIFPQSPRQMTEKHFLKRNETFLTSSSKCVEQSQSVNLKGKKKKPPPPPVTHAQRQHSSVTSYTVRITTNVPTVRCVLGFVFLFVCLHKFYSK